MLILGTLNIIPKNTRFFIVVELLFKVSLSLFLIFYIGNHKKYELDKNERLIIMGSGIVILLLINYKKDFDEIFYNAPRIKDF
jgi:membrane-associated HD superfamily phosphohydrolase